MTREVVVEGAGLHTGEPSRVTLRARPGPVAIAQRGAEVAVGALAVVDRERATTLADPSGRVRLATVEHLFSALAAFGVYEGLAIVVEGSELPILDGGAARWSEALATLGLAGSAPRLVAVRDDDVEVARSRLVVRRGPPSVEVHLGFDDPRVAPRARFAFDREDYVARIAPSRTFAFASEVAGMMERGLARHVPPEAAVVLAPDAVLCAGRPFRADEPACHKLLDLLGDLYVYGGPPRARLEVHRPGHGANHALVAAALARGSLARCA
jgi:UDP-3-O-[3-hydroxymyristoyl] N-acetylglucosamine deacetylase